MSKGYKEYKVNRDMKSGLLVGIASAVIVIGFIAAYGSGMLNVISGNAKNSSRNLSNNISQVETKTVSGVEVKSFTTTPDAPIELQILNNESFVLVPQSIKTYAFTLDHPSYPIKVTGDMAVTDHNKKVTFVIHPKDNALNIAPMSTSPDYGIAKIGRFYAGMNQDYVYIESFDVNLSDRDNPNFTATFTNDGDIDQMVIANLKFEYGQ